MIKNVDLFVCFFFGTNEPTKNRETGFNENKAKIVVFIDLLCVGFFFGGPINQPKIM